ncbi:hypothetical protein CLV30_102173 [Haloactinopolyspora alba]|uniref:DUF4287 domain-containing protein n=1 Tax=Haloactinopolyspora alba TaxID=648780 RepID=A0A2P8EBD0_9ACTN|nr:hypothetical protein [Haloactinopolyspora alba]PSL06785.1 hypothetical protein CLV30_102173 [Haloactinopolyspora alba]
MTRQKSFKTLVRARMEKTGESYTTARRHVAEKQHSTSDSGVDVEPAVTDTDSGAPPGVRPQQFSDESVLAHTGRTWAEWFSELDAWGGTERRHSEIAGWIVEQHDVPGWWAQGITVAYEQARGMRAPGQRSDGYFTANASKTVSVPVERLFEAFSDDELRERWLLGATLEVRTVRAPKSFRARWGDGSTRLVAGFERKSEEKSQVSLAHEKLPDADAAGQMKSYWRERLAELKQLLEA